MRRFHPPIIAALLVAWLTPGHAPGNLRAAPDVPVQVTEQDGGVLLEWHDSAPQLQTGSFSTSGWSPVVVGGMQLPAQLIPLRVPEQAQVQPHVIRLSSMPWDGAIATAKKPILRTDAGDERPALAHASPQAIPQAPVAVLRDGRLRGVRIVVLSFSPIFEQAGRLRVATDVAAMIPGTRLLDQDIAQILDSSAPFLASAPGPTNPLAAGPAAKVQVTAGGMQRVTGAALAAAGLDLSDAAKIHVSFRGTEVAAEVRDGSDGRLDSSDELRFYAPPPGDRWNAADMYWITVDAMAGRRMTTRPALPETAPPRDTAYQSGVWRERRLYDSTLPGPDGDHWFAVDLKTGPELPPKTVTAMLTPDLPLAPGAAVLTVSGSAYTDGEHQLNVERGMVQAFLPLISDAPAPTGNALEQARRAGAGSPTSVLAWRGAGNWTHTITFTSNLAFAAITLLPGAAPDGIELDSIAWQRPVQLDFSGYGARFTAVPGIWQYRLRNTAASRELYDVSDPQAPVALAIPDGATTTFQDGPGPRQYLLTGPGTLHEPAVTAHTPTNLAAPLNADVLYIAPAPLTAALAPLVALRTAQGDVVRVVDVQAIYDAWSFGQVDPQAIRAFLRYAAATWSRVPKAVTLVGDGTRDPLDFSAKNHDGNHNNVNLVPPYLAMVDPWQGETACETCYAQLDGDDALSDLLPDLMIGRLPVKSAADLEHVVAKITRYETGQADRTWQSRNVYLADNYREADGQADAAGDFAAFADSSAALQPPGIQIERVYYDPSPSHVGVPWRVPDAAQASERALAAINTGAALVNYVGHSNEFNMAITNIDPHNGPQYLLSLYDADRLTNRDRLAVMLQMTCLTSAFHTPAFSGTTIDERLLLNPNGGAVAVWGSTGKGVLFGHDKLQRGFYRQLWAGTPMPPLGVVTTAGYQELFTTGGCCQETIQTFALLGDPLTPVRAVAN